MCLALLPLAALAQNVRPPAPPRSQAVTPAGNTQPQPDAVADRATQMIRCQTESDADLAISGCSALIQSGSLSDNAMAAIFGRRAALYVQQNNNEKAMSDILQSMLLAPGDASLYALRGRVAQALQQYPEAIDSYSHCLQLDPGRSECETTMAMLQTNLQKETDACSASGDPDEVISACSVLIGRSPRVARFFNARGVAYYNKKDFRHALEDFSAAIRLEPQDSALLTNRCNVYLQTRQYTRAIDDCDNALHSKPDNAQALYARGLAKFNRDDADGAITDFNAALAKNPPTPALVQGYRGAAYLKKGDLISAEKDLNEALHLMPTSAGVRAYMGGLYVEQNQFDKAIDELNTALQFNPNLAVALIYRGRAYIKKRQMARGLKDLDDAVKAEPDNAFVFQARGLVYVSLGQSAKAAADFKTCRVLDIFAPCGGAKPEMPPALKPVVTKTSKPAAKLPVTANAKPVVPVAKPPVKASVVKAPVVKAPAAKPPAVKPPAAKPQPKK